VRDAGREDLYALQQGPDPLDPFDFRDEPPQVLHKNCGGRVSYQPGHITDTDRYVCNGVNKTFGKCGWAYRCSAVHAWADVQIAAALYVPEKEDERIYKLELVVGKKGAHDSPTHYHLRPATAEERRNYARRAADTWNVK
jgi:hypothetical protein